MLGVAALRPAPIIITYLGFPGTTATDFVDYAIVDRIVVPENQDKNYSEKLIYLPCYQVQGYSQYKRPTSFPKKKRGDEIVFCSFNPSLKITSEMFDVWMRILKKVPRSALWLNEDFEEAKINLAKEAQKRGGEWNRLLFCKRVLFGEHLERVSRADIALDTFHYNGGATTSNALWAGVPVVTMQGNNYISRMSSSLLIAVGIPDLITHSYEEYENLVVSLANNPKKLNAIRSILLTGKKSDLLFDTRVFVKNLEKEYLRVWNQR